MKSIWYFVGLLLSTMGAIITIEGIYRMVSPPAETKVLAYLHADLWWGLFMLAFGLFFTLFHRKKTVEESPAAGSSARTEKG